MKTGKGQTSEPEDGDVEPLLSDYKSVARWRYLIVTESQNGKEASLLTFLFRKGALADPRQRRCAGLETYSGGGFLGIFWFGVQCLCFM